jgi:hypothetical protein
MESETTAGDSPVRDNEPSPGVSPSKTSHVEPGLNPGGPSPKKTNNALVSPPVKSSRRPLRTHKSQKDLCCLRGCWERRTGGPGGACCSSLNQTNHPVSVLHVPSPGVVVAHAQRAKVFCPKKVVDFCACARAAASSAACVVEDVGGGRCRVGDRGFDFPLAVFQFVGLKQKLGSGKIN